MAWVLQDESDRAIIAEIEKQSDRGAILVAISLLERRLEETIKAQLRQDIDPELNGKIFKGYGPLATFAAKIDIGFLLQIYPDDVHLLLHELRRLRNDAAHETTPISFEFPSIRDRCRNLVQKMFDLWCSMQGHQAQLMFITNTRLGQSGGKALYSDGHESSHFSLQLDPPTTREKFFVLIKAVLIHLHEVKVCFERSRLAL